MTEGGYLNSLGANAINGGSWGKQDGVEASLLDDVNGQWSMSNELMGWTGSFFIWVLFCSTCDGNADIWGRRFFRKRRDRVCVCGTLFCTIRAFAKPKTASLTRIAIDIMPSLIRFR